MTTPHLTQQSDRWVIPISGAEVTQCRFDYAVILVVEKEGSFEFRIEQPFTFVDPGGEQCCLDPERDPQGADRTLALMQDRVTSAAAHKDGRLDLDFESGATIRVPAGAKYESWNLAGPNGLRLVAVPDGGLTVWSGSQSADEQPGDSNVTA